MVSTVLELPLSTRSLQDGGGRATGPRPVAYAPDWTLPDCFGRPRSLQEFLKVGPLVLAFYRGHWCPYCRRYLSKLQANAERIEHLGAGLVAISPEDVATSRRLAAELSLSFPVLCDPEGVTIDAYGVRNTFSSVRTLLPHPAVFVIDSAGVITFKSVDRNYKKRTTVRTILHEVAAVTGAVLPATD